MCVQVLRFSHVAARSNFVPPFDFFFFAGPWVLHYGQSLVAAQLLLLG